MRAWRVYDAAMQRFHLNLYNQQYDLLDEEGHLLADLPTARARAIVSIRELLCADLAQGTFDLRGRMTITDEDGALLMTVPFVDAVTIKLP